MRRSYAIVVLILLLGAGCAEPVAPSTADSASSAGSVPEYAPNLGPLRCTIRSAPTYQLGKAPAITVEIKNLTNSDIYLVGSLDASDCKWRYPHCYFEVIGPDGNPASRGIARCGNMDTLQKNHFVRVPPGGTFDPYKRTGDSGFYTAHQLTGSNFQTAGEYRIRFLYSSRSNAIGEWSGDSRAAVAANEKLLALFKKVPKVEVRSNEIRVTMVEPRK